MDRISSIKERHRIEIDIEYDSIARELPGHAAYLSKKIGYRYTVPGGFKLSEVMEFIGMDNSTNRRVILERELKKRGFTKTGGTFWVPKDKNLT